MNINANAAMVAAMGLMIGQEREERYFPLAAPDLPIHLQEEVPALPPGTQNHNP